jgi:hypothetical protein
MQQFHGPASPHSGSLIAVVESAWRCAESMRMQGRAIHNLKWGLNAKSVA